MYEFEYVRPKSVAEAAGFLAANGEARLMSGGMTLLPTMKQRLAQASHLVHVGPLGELKSIVREGDVLVVGSAATHDQVEQSEVARAAIPALARLAGGIGEALVSTEAGLLIAIPALLGHNYLANRVDDLIADAEYRATRTLNVLWPKG